MRTAALNLVESRPELSFVSTTKSRSGYPTKVKSAIIGFENFRDAEDNAHELGWEVQLFEKRDGHDLWYRDGCMLLYPISFRDLNFGDDYRWVEKMSEEDFYDKEVVEPLQNATTALEAKAIIDAKVEVWQMLDFIQDDEVVLTDCGKYAETYEKEPMEFHDRDVHQYVIGIISTGDEEDEDDEEEDD